MKQVFWQILPNSLIVKSSWHSIDNLCLWLSFLNRFSYSWIPTHTLTSQSTSLLWNHFFTEVHFFLCLLLFLDPSAAERAVRTFKWPPPEVSYATSLGYRVLYWMLHIQTNNTNKFDGCKNMESYCLSVVPRPGSVALFGWYGFLYFFLLCGQESISPHWVLINNNMYKSNLMYSNDCNYSQSLLIWHQAG